MRLGPIEHGRKNIRTLAGRGCLICFAFACLLCYAWAVLGLALMGRGVEMGRFGHCFEQPSHLEGGSSMPDFSICTDQAPTTTVETLLCGWDTVRRVEKNIRSGHGRAARYAMLACFACLLCLLGIAISLKDPASKQPLPDFPGLRMRDYAKHLGASLLAPPLPFEINLGPPRVVGEVNSLLLGSGQLNSRGCPICLLCLLCFGGP